MSERKSPMADVLMALIIALFNPLALAVWLIIAMLAFHP